MRGSDGEEPMAIVDSSEEEDFLGLWSESSKEDDWIFPVSKPPTEANYDTSFVQFVENAMNAMNLKRNKISKEESLVVEQGRPDRTDQVIADVPLFLGEGYSMSLQEFDPQMAFRKVSSKENSGLRSPDYPLPSVDISNDNGTQDIKSFRDVSAWLDFDNSQELDYFKHQFEYLYEESKKPKLIHQTKMDGLSNQKIKKSRLNKKDFNLNNSDIGNEENSFLKGIIMTSTPQRDYVTLNTTKQTNEVIQSTSNDSNLICAPRSIEPFELLPTFNSYHPIVSQKESRTKNNNTPKIKRHTHSQDMKKALVIDDDFDDLQHESIEQKRSLFFDKPKKINKIKSQPFFNLRK